MSSDTPGHLRVISSSPPTDPLRPSDDALMALAAGGDAHAFGQLVTRHQRAVRRLCFVILREESLARDIAQDAFIQVWNHRARYTPQGSFREFLFTAARHLSLRCARKRRWLSFFGLTHEEPGAPAPVAVEVDPANAQAASLVRAAMSRLPEHFRVPIVLRFVDGLSYEAIAAIIGRTPSAARSRVHYGLKALGALLPEDLAP